jgi:predicted nuclease with TOPRIM domain
MNEVYISLISIIGAGMLGLIGTIIKRKWDALDKKTEHEVEKDKDFRTLYLEKEAQEAVLNEVISNLRVEKTKLEGRIALLQATYSMTKKEISNNDN